MLSHWVPSSSKRNTSMRDNGRITKETVEASSNGEMAPSTRGTGRITWPTDTDGSFTPMEMCI